MNLTKNKLDIENDLKKLINTNNKNDGSYFIKEKDIGEDIFLGIRVPDLRKLANKIYQTISLDDIEFFLHSKYHEYRHFALIILVYKFEFKKISEKEKEEIYQFYLNNLDYINSWMLVDVSASYILGRYLFENDSNFKLLEKLNNDPKWFKRRISLIACHYFIKNNKYYQFTLQLVKNNLDDKEDLMQKAIGWTLKIIGDKDQTQLIIFLKENKKMISNLALKYALEKQSNEVKQQLLIK